MDLALIGFGRVGRAFARLLDKKRASFPFRIVGIHTARHGTALNAKGLGPEPQFGPAASSIESFLDAAKAEIAIEITPLNPLTGEPAIAHIRAAFARHMHVITANKALLAEHGPVRCAGVSIGGPLIPDEGLILSPPWWLMSGENWAWAGCLMTPALFWLVLRNPGNDGV